MLPLPTKNLNLLFTVTTNHVSLKNMNLRFAMKFLILSRKFRPHLCRMTFGDVIRITCAMSELRASVNQLGWGCVRSRVRADVVILSNPRSDSASCRLLHLWPASLQRNTQLHLYPFLWQVNPPFLSDRSLEGKNQSGKRLRSQENCVSCFCLSGKKHFIFVLEVRP